MTAWLAYRGEAADAPRGDALDLRDDAAYRGWRAIKLAHRPTDAAELTVDIVDPRRLGEAEARALRRTISRCSMALYRSPVLDDDPALARRLGEQLGLRRLDANWLAEEDGLSRIEVSGRRDASAGKAGYIPYSTHAIRWHTDGYYHPDERRIHALQLHCVRPAASGGVNRLLDHELAYIALRDESPHLVRALMRPDAMTIPARHDDDGRVARAAQRGPVLCVEGGRLHLRYTARTRSIEWHADADVQAAAAFLASWLDSSPPGQLTVRLEAGMGLIGHNVLHDRSAFVDDPASPRLLFRARWRDRIAGDD